MAAQGDAMRRKGLIIALMKHGVRTPSLCAWRLATVGSLQFQVMLNRVRVLRPVM